MKTFVQFITEEETPHFNTAEELRNHVEKHYPGAHLDLYDTSKQNHAHLSKISVPKHMQKQGIGSKLMKHVTDYGDHTGRVLTLSPESEGRGQPSKKKLEHWYKGFGFKSNLGRKRDYRFSGSMLRHPVEKK